MIHLAAFATILQPPAFLRMPDIHGDKVVFTCEGDLWVGTISTGKAIRLTRDEGLENYAKFSPDGQTIAFRGDYDGVGEIYTISVNGGSVTRLTYRYDYADPQGWSADGSKVLFRARTFPRSYGLYTVPAKGGQESKINIEFAAHGSFGGENIYFTRFNRHDDAWFRYEGGMQNQVWRGDLATNSFKKITNEPGTNEFPCASGGNVYFANERDGAFKLMSVGQSGGKAKQMAGPFPLELRELNEGPGGVVFEKGAGICLLDPTSGKVRDLDFTLDSDLLHTRPFTVAASAQQTNLSIGPTGKRVLGAVRGQIIDLPVGEGESRLWKRKVGARLEAPKMSPDGKSVAYISDQSGEPNVWIAKADGTGERQLTNSSKRQIKFCLWSPDAKWIVTYDSEMRLNLVDAASGAQTEITHNADTSWYGLFYSFSPDSKYIAYSETDGVTGFARTAVRELATGKVTFLGTGFTHDKAPAFSQDGKYLAFASRRSFVTTGDELVNQMNTLPPDVLCVYLLRPDVENPLALKDPAEPEKSTGESKPEDKKVPATGIVFEGIEDRLVMLPTAPSSINQVEFSGSRILYTSEGEIKFFDLVAKAGGSVTAGGTFEMSDDGKKLLVGNRVVDAGGTSVPPTAGALTNGALRLQVEPVAEWTQMYWDAWRLLRDYFYVANMHGLDWDAIGKKYAVYLPNLRSRDELDILIRWLQAELGSSHQYLSPGDEQSLKPMLNGAFLGIDVVSDAAANRLKITKIYRGDGIDVREQSPLIQPGFKVAPGDYLIAVAGQPLDANSQYLRHLEGRAGQTVSVTVASKADGSDKRTIFVKPFNLNAWRRMGLMDWVRRNREYVAKATDGKVGYLYLQAMLTQDMNDFVRQFYPQRHKQAIVIDARFNNGGNVQNVINRILSEKITGWFNMRGNEFGFTRQGDYFKGYMALLTNEFSVSCGEEFPHKFRELKLGPIIGRRTYGGEVGSSPGWPLMDGGVVSVPNYGMWTEKDGWVIESEGVSPDIDVESDPNAFAAGKDAQLDKAIQVLMESATKNPVVWPKQPPDPVKAKNGGRVIG